MRGAMTRHLVIGKPIGLAGGLLVFLAQFYAPCGSAAQGIGHFLDKDGIVAKFDATNHEVLIGWRFRHPLPAPIASISVTANGQPLGLPTDPVGPFPALGQKASILYLDDLGDPHRPTARALSERVVGLPAGIVALQGSFGQPSPGTTFDPSLRSFGDDLVSALGGALDALATTSADRRAILVFTDGCAQDEEAAETIASRARAADIPIFVVLDPSSRCIDRIGIDRLVEVSRGAILKPADNLAPQILRTILSGAELRFPLDLAPRLFWQAPQASLVATIAYGDRKLALEMAIDRPVARGSSAVALIHKQAEPYLKAFGVGAGLMLAVGLALAAALGRSSMRRSATVSGGTADA
jgi:hypothetical protein